jgi:AcrR family transcriptional regulator
MSIDASSVPPGTRMDRRRRQTRSALLEAGRRLISERGVDGVTIQEITDAADVAKGSFYNHFDSREDLQRAAAQIALEEIGAANDRDVEAREVDTARVIAASVLSTLRTCLADPALGGFLLKSADTLEIGEALLIRGRRDLIRGKRSGRFAIEDVDLLLSAIAGAVQGVLRARLRGELPAAAETRFIALVLRMLGLEAGEATLIATEVTARVAGGTS